MEKIRDEFASYSKTEFFQKYIGWTMDKSGFQQRQRAKECQRERDREREL